MGLILGARCASCGFERRGLRLGATMAQMSGERRSAHHLFACRACSDVTEVELFLGEPEEPPACPRCREPVSLARSNEYRVARLSGNRLEGHPCPRCGESALAFEEEGSFL